MLTIIYKLSKLIFLSSYFKGLEVNPRSGELFILFLDDSFDSQLHVLEERHMKRSKSLNYARQIQLVG